MYPTSTSGHIYICINVSVASQLKFRCVCFRKSSLFFILASGCKCTVTLSQYFRGSGTDEKFNCSSDGYSCHHVLSSNHNKASLSQKIKPFQSRVTCFSNQTCITLNISVSWGFKPDRGNIVCLFTIFKWKLKLNLNCRIFTITNIL